MMNKRKNIILIMMLIGVTVVTKGQGIREAVTVEGRYVPEVIAAERLAVLPSTLTLTAPESGMSYDRRGVTANFAPDALNMPATGWRARKAFDASRGYVDLWLGSWLNASLSAGFAAIQKEDTRLNVWLQHNSTSLWKPHAEGAGEQGADRRFVYDEKIGGDLTHRFAGVGALSADLRYHLGYFNYYGVEDFKAPTQTLNDVYARVGWKGLENRRFRYSGEADVRYFGYSRRVRWGAGDNRGDFGPGERETTFNVGGEVGYSLSDEAGNGSAVGVGVRYSQVCNSIGNDVKRIEGTPAYTLTGRDYSLRLGVNLAAIGQGERKIRVAPDVRFGWRKGTFAFSATVGGGTHLRTLAWKSMMDYYSDPGTGCYRAAYSPIDARIGVQLNPGGRWTFGVEGAWRTTLDETFGGWYVAWLNKFSWDHWLSSMIVPSDYNWERYQTGGKIHGYSLSVNAGYEFSRYLGLKGRASWQPQDGEKGYLNGFDRPEVTVDLSAESKPLDALSLRLDWRLRARRFPTAAASALLGNFSQLDFGGSYRITEKVAVGVEVRNLMNRKQCLLPDLPLEGINAAAGFQITF